MVATLQYDDSAASYFMLMICSLYLGLAGLYTFMYLRRRSVDPLATARTTEERKRMEKQGIKGPKPLWTTAFSIHVAVMGIVAILLVVSIFQVVLHGEVEQYNPFTVLGLESTATEREIKKAYRKMSIVYHPDKRNGDDEMFLKIAKAYETLTDETAKENYRLYGNPDGRQALEVGVGLPPWLANITGQYILLISYLAAFAVGVPVLMYFTRKNNMPEIKMRVTNRWSQMMIMHRTSGPVTQDTLVPACACVAELQWEQMFKGSYPQVEKVVMEIAKSAAKSPEFKCLGAPDAVNLPYYHPRQYLPPNFPPNQPFHHLKHGLGLINSLVLWEYLARRNHSSFEKHVERPKKMPKDKQKIEELEQVLKQRAALAKMLDANAMNLRPYLPRVGVQALKFARLLNFDGYRQLAKVGPLLRSDEVQRSGPAAHRDSVVIGRGTCHEKPTPSPMEFRTTRPQHVDAALCASELAQCICQAILPRQHPIVQIPVLWEDATALTKKGSSPKYSLEPLSQALQIGEEELLARYLAGVFPGEGQALTEEQQRAVDKARPSRLAVPLTAAGLKGRAAVGVLEGEPAVVQERELSKLCSLDLPDAKSQRKVSNVLRPLLLKDIRPVGSVDDTQLAGICAMVDQSVAKDTEAGKSMDLEAAYTDTTKVAQALPLLDVLAHARGGANQEGTFTEQELLHIDVRMVHLNAMSKEEVAAWVQEKEDRVEDWNAEAKRAWLEAEAGFATRKQEALEEQDAKGVGAGAGGAAGAAGAEEGEGGKVNPGAGESNEKEDEEEEDIFVRNVKRRQALMEREAEKGWALRATKEPVQKAHAPLFPGKAGAGWVLQVLDDSDNAMVLTTNRGRTTALEVDQVHRYQRESLQIMLPEVYDESVRARFGADVLEGELQPHPLSLWLVFKSKAYRGLDFRVRLVVPVLPRGSLGVAGLSAADRKFRRDMQEGRLDPGLDLMAGLGIGQADRDDQAIDEDDDLDSDDEEEDEDGDEEGEEEEDEESGDHQKTE